MSDERLSRSQSAICKVIGIALALAALFRSTIILAAGTAPDLLAISIHCNSQGCTIEPSPLDLLPERLRVAASAIPGVTPALEAHLRQAAVRQDFLVGQLIIDLPMIGLLASVAWGIFMLGQSRGRALGTAIPWLRRGAFFALVAVVATDFGQAVQTQALARAFEANPGFALNVNVGQVALNLMLGLVALAVIWALSAGIRAERDLAEIV